MNNFINWQYFTFCLTMGLLFIGLAVVVKMKGQ